MQEQDGANQTDKSSDVARIMDVGDPDKTADIRNAQAIARFLPVGIVAGVANTEKIPDDGRGKCQDENDQKPSEAFTEGFPRRPGRNRDPCQKPSRKKSRPAGRENENKTCSRLASHYLDRDQK